MLVEINHSRKGTFKALLLKDSGDWITVQIVNGTAKYISDEDKQFGEVLIIRKSLCKIKEVENV